jgi:hypothetical protein
MLPSTVPPAPRRITLDVFSNGLRSWPVTLSTPARTRQLSKTNQRPAPRRISAAFVGGVLSYRSDRELAAGHDRVGQVLEEPGGEADPDLQFLAAWIT